MTWRDAIVGDRVRLVHTSDEYTTLPSGTMGTVRVIDDVGTLHVDWDNGSKLGLVPDEDRWEIIWLENPARGGAP
jgi:hypothetical protein